MTRLVTTRRHFMAASAAASASTLLIGHAHAAVPKGGTVMANFGIALAGAEGAWLRSLKLPEHEIAAGTKGSVFGVGQFHASLPVSGPHAVLDWCLSLPRKQAMTTDGAVFMTDFALVPKRRIGWTNGQLTSVAFPKLSANEAKKPFAIDFKWQPEVVDYQEGAKKVKIPAADKAQAKAWLTSNFKFKGSLPEPEFLVGVGLPTFTAARSTKGAKDVKGGYGGVEIGSLTLEFASRSREAVYKYVKSVIQDGQLSDKEYLDFGIELLDPSLTKTVGNIELYGCGLRSYEEDKYEAGSEKQAKFTLTFSVERFDMKG